MEKKAMYEVMTRNPVIHLATVENGEPRVRAVLLYSAGEKGIIFHTGTFKDVYKQIASNPSVEMCFNDLKAGLQIRVRGRLEEITDNGFKDTIAETPGREFLKKVRESGALNDFYADLHVFCLKNGTARTWTMETNFAPTKTVQL